MKQLTSRLMDGMSIFYNTHRVYKKLQNHLNAQPIGFPATITGVERRILQSFFYICCCGPLGYGGAQGIRILVKN